MNPRTKLILTGAAAFIAGGLLVFFLPKHAGKAESDEAAPETARVKPGPAGETIVVLDAETQKRVGLVVTNLIAAQWQPEVKGFGHAIDPATLASAVAELETARTAAEASDKEYDRLKTLADQNNVSARNLDAARAAATRDRLAFETARAKFAAGWGKRLAENPTELLKALTDGETALFRIALPAGKVVGTPRGARIVPVTGDEVARSAEYFDTGVGIDPATQMQSFLFKSSGNLLPAGTAVAGIIALEGDAAPGAEVPAAAVLRHQGKAWIYVQTAGNEFTRREIADFNAAGGWFAHDLAATNRVVIAGVQAVLSTELSSGGFNTGERD